MGMSEKYIGQLIHGDIRLTPDIADELEMVLGILAQS